jgi:spore coat polysaccharide biosynthesis protein SpsF (cytidylyltransferase family)
MITKAAIVICTRPDSSRLPRKVFKKIAGKPAFDHLLSRLKDWKYPIVIAVPTGCKEYDDYISRYKEIKDLRLYEGHPTSPLHRMANALSDLDIQTKWVVRITHDDILIDLQTIESLITHADGVPECGYAITPTIVNGAGVEIFRYENLIYAAETRKEPTEFISYFVNQKPFPQTLKVHPRKSIERPYRLTLDYEQDATVLDIVFKQVGHNATLDQIVTFLDLHPFVLNINKQPDTTIYTCAFNAEEYIEETIHSVLSVKDIDFEYIVIDDASEDSTLLKISRYANDKRLKIIVNESNMGLSSSCNRALLNSRGDTIIRVDADDWIRPEAILKMKHQMISTGAGIVYAGYKETDIKGNIINDGCIPQIEHHAGCALMDKRLLNEFKFKDGLRHWDSFELYKRFQDRVPISYIDEPLWYYRRGHNSLSTTDIENRKFIYQQIQNTHTSV